MGCHQKSPTDYYEDINYDDFPNGSDIIWVYIWPQNRPKRSLSNLSWNFWVFPVTSSGRNGKQKGGECFCFGNFLALFVLPSLLCAHSHQERENWEKPSHVLITHLRNTKGEIILSLYIQRLQPLIVHPGFGDLQKWILQVKYSLVAKEWVSDSKILKRRKKDP